MRYSILISFALVSAHAHLPTFEQTEHHRIALDSHIPPYCTALPEGGFVYFFNKELFPFLEKRLSNEALMQLKSKLKPHLQIPFSREGFAMASTRRSENETDETGYSAIWVHDACWHYFGLATDDRANAKRLILGLLRFYSTPEQKIRFLSVIADPSIADPQKNSNAHMDVPLIRFSRQSLSHHQVEGKDQVWNHLQFDSHALFLLALTDALKEGILSPRDLTQENFDLLALFPAFFARTEYWDRKDSGPWEEELMNNASTIGLIAASLRQYKEVLIADSTIKEQLLKRARLASSAPLLVSHIMPHALDTLYEKGLERVKLNLSLGCEAPDLSGSGNHRRADAALLFLCLPKGSLFYNNEEMTQKVLDIVLSLVGPYGVFRYKLDAYQALNYWIDYQIPSAIMGPKTSDLKILTRFEKGYVPANQPYDAQWFFDSLIAAIYYRLCDLSHESIKREFYLTRGDFHLKRALGQLTGEEAIAANGERLPPLSLPESINTLFDQKYSYRPLPSPICPLSWSVASMRIALDGAGKAHITSNSAIQQINSSKK